MSQDLAPLVREIASRLQKPIGVASWETRPLKTRQEELQESLPIMAEIKSELGQVERR